MISSIENKPKSKMIDGKWVKFIEDTERWIKSYELVN